MAAATLSGRNVSITATGGDITLGAAHVNATQGVSANAVSGAVNFGVVTTGTQLEQGRGEHDWAYQRTRESGSLATSANYTQINGGTLAINAGQVNVQIGQDATGGKDGPLRYTQTVQQTLAAQAGQPGMNWLNQIQKDPKLSDLQVNWQGVPVVQRQWAEGQGGLTQAGAAVAAIVVTVLTWGAASEVGGAVATSAGEGVAVNGGGYFLTGTGGIMSATVAAGVSSIASQAAVSLINNNGNIGAVLDDLGSSRGIRSILASMISAGVGAAYPTSSGVTGVAVQTAAGCATGALTGQGCARGAAASGLISGLQAAGYYLRQDQIRSSQLFQGVVDENGNFLTNTSGSSGGVNGDGIKIGGNRVDLGQLCGVAGICTNFTENQPVPPTWMNPADGRVYLMQGVSLESVIASNPGLTPSPLGGLQGGLPSIGGLPYAPGSFLDKLVESFAGPHDFLNAVHYYDALGNNVNNGASEIWNVIDLLPSMPIGLATLATQYPDVWQAVVNAYGNEKSLKSDQY